MNNVSDVRQKNKVSNQFSDSVDNNTVPNDTNKGNIQSENRCLNKVESNCFKENFPLKSADHSVKQTDNQRIDNGCNAFGRRLLSLLISCFTCFLSP